MSGYNNYNSNNNGSGGAIQGHIGGGSPQEGDISTGSSLFDIKQQLIDDVKVMLGESMVDVELDGKDYNTALRLSLDRYRQRSSNAVEEAYAFLELQEEQTEYYLPKEIVDVRQVFRRGIGGSTTGTYIDPFSLAYTNLYLLQAGAGGGYSAGLLTYELFYDYQEQAGRMFGRDINYHYNTVTKKLTLVRRLQAEETVLLWVTKVKPDEMILQDPFALPWVRSYTIAIAKNILGQAYSKWNGSVIGPGGPSTLKGDALKAESKEEIEKLETEILQYVDNGTPYGIILG